MNCSSGNPNFHSGVIECVTRKPKMCVSLFPPVIYFNEYFRNAFLHPPWSNRPNHFPYERKWNASNYTNACTYQSINLWWFHSKDLEGTDTCKLQRRPFQAVTLHLDKTRHKKHLQEMTWSENLSRHHNRVDASTAIWRISTTVDTNVLITTLLIPWPTTGSTFWFVQ